MAESARTNDDDIASREEPLRGLPYRVVRGEASICERSDALGLERSIELNDCSSIGFEELCHPTVCVEAREA